MRLPFKSLLLVSACASLFACGGRALETTPDNGTVDASPGNTGGSSSSSSSSSSGSSSSTGSTPMCTQPVNTPPSPNAQNVGAVIAGLGVAGTSQSQSIFAAFPAFGGPIYTPSATAPGCACHAHNGIADPPPFSNAGTITIASPDCGPSLATLTYSGGDSYPYMGMSSPSWSPGSVLDVSATGGMAASNLSNGISAFTGTLQTVVPPAVLSPAIFGPSAQPTALPLDQPLVVTWTPEGLPGETVLVYVSQINEGFAECMCVAPDAAGTLTIAASSLMQTFQASANASEAASATWSRSVVSRVADGSAQEVDLVGQVELDGSVLFQ
jgi:hypothetical protein